MVLSSDSPCLHFPSVQMTGTSQHTWISCRISSIIIMKINTCFVHCFFKMSLFKINPCHRASTVRGQHWTMELYNLVPGTDQVCVFSAFPPSQGLSVTSLGTSSNIGTLTRSTANALCVEGGPGLAWLSASLSPENET